MSKYQVIFHLDEDDPFRVNLVLNNIRNLLEDLGEDHLELELVAYASGLKLFLKNSGYDKIMKNLTNKGVIFAACSNTVNAMNLSPDKMIDNVKIVSSGVGELVKKQAEGWIYIRP